MSMERPVPDNIVRAGRPSGSALMVATLRAVHQLLDEPVVLPDPIALPILGAEVAAALREDPFSHNDPLSRGLRAALVVRSRFAEDELARAIKAGVRQFVILGAGLDTFAHRHPHGGSGLQIFEVDHPSTQLWKRGMLSTAGIETPAELHFVPVDFEHGALPQGLANAGFRVDRPACFSWLGVTMYLTEQAVMECLSFIAGLQPGSSVSFDYNLLPSSLDRITRVVVEVLGERLAAAGEPWVSAFEPDALRRKVLALGFSEIVDCGPEQLNPRYLARRKDGLRYGGGVRLACARV